MYIETESRTTYLIPAAKTWNLVRRAEHNGTWDVRGLSSLEEAGTLLKPGEDFVLGLPASVVLAQRLQLPTVERDEFAEMARIQIEKAMPYSTEEMTTGSETISQSDDGSVISAVAVHNESLAELVRPLLSRDLIPRQVTVYAAQRAATHAPPGSALLIYTEGEAIVCAIAEEGKLSFTRTLDAADPLQLQRDLPQMILSAELQGINTSFSKIFLDESLYSLRDTVEGIFSVNADFIAVEVPPADTELNLLPESWRQRRLQVEKQAEWRKRLIWIGIGYVGLFFLSLLFLGILKFQIGRLDGKIAADAPRTDFVKATDARWRALAPAIDPRYYPIEVLQHLTDSLPSADVRITKFDQSARQISAEGEANTAQLAYQFAEKVKNKPELQMFQFDMASPRLLPNGHAQFRLEGKPR